MDITFWTENEVVCQEKRFNCLQSGLIRDYDHSDRLKKGTGILAEQLVDAVQFEKELVIKSSMLSEWTSQLKNGWVDDGSSGSITFRLNTINALLASHLQALFNLTNIVTKERIRLERDVNVETFHKSTNEIIFGIEELYKLVATDQLVSAKTEDDVARMTSEIGARIALLQSLSVECVGEVLKNVLKKWKEVGLVVISFQSRLADSRYLQNVSKKTKELMAWMQQAQFKLLGLCYGQTTAQCTRLWTQHEDLLGAFRDLRVEMDDLVGQFGRFTGLLPEQVLEENRKLEDAFNCLIQLIHVRGGYLQEHLYQLEFLETADGLLVVMADITAQIHSLISHSQMELAYDSYSKHVGLHLSILTMMEDALGIVDAGCRLTGTETLDVEGKLDNLQAYRKDLISLWEKRAVELAEALFTSVVAYFGSMPAELAQPFIRGHLLNAFEREVIRVETLLIGVVGLLSVSVVVEGESDRCLHMILQRRADDVLDRLSGLQSAVDYLFSSKDRLFEFGMDVAASASEVLAHYDLLKAQADKNKSDLKSSQCVSRYQETPLSPVSILEVFRDMNEELTSIQSQSLEGNVSQTVSNCGAGLDEAIIHDGNMGSSINLIPSTVKPTYICISTGLQASSEIEIVRLSVEKELHWVLECRTKNIINELGHPQLVEQKEDMLSRAHIITQVIRNTLTVLKNADGCTDLLAKRLKELCHHLFSYRVQLKLPSRKKQIVGFESLAQRIISSKGREPVVVSGNWAQAEHDRLVVDEFFENAKKEVAWTSSTVATVNQMFKSRKTRTCALIQRIRKEIPVRKDAIILVLEEGQRLIAAKLAPNKDVNDICEAIKENMDQMLAKLNCYSVGSQLAIINKEWRSGIKFYGSDHVDQAEEVQSDVESEVGSDETNFTEAGSVLTSAFVTHLNCYPPARPTVMKPPNRPITRGLLDPTPESSPRTSPTKKRVRRATRRFC